MSSTSHSGLKRKSSNLMQFIRKRLRRSNRKDSTHSSESIESTLADQERAVDARLSLDLEKEQQPTEVDLQPKLVDPVSSEEAEVILQRRLPTTTATTSVSQRRGEKAAAIPCLTVINTSSSSEKDSLSSNGSISPSMRDCLLSASDSGLYSETEEDDLVEVFSDDVYKGDWEVKAQDLSLTAKLVATPQETVYSGYWHGPVAVHARKGATQNQRKKVSADLDTLKNIRHENIQLFMGVSYDLHPDYIAIVMDQMKGPSLHHLLHRQGRQFNFQELTKVVSQITQGLDYLHAKGISHPLLTSQSVTLHCRVCISMLTPGSASLGLIRTSDLPYLAPEAMRTVRKYSSSSEGNMTCPSSPHLVQGLRTRCVSASRLLNSLSHSPSPTRSTPTSPSIKSTRRLFETSGYTSPGFNVNRRGSCDEARTEYDDHEKVELLGNTKVMQTPEANIFSFGTLLYELVKLEKPYKNIEGNMIIYRVSKGEIQHLGDHFPEGKFKQMIKKCWRLNSTSRPSFKELQSSFEQNMSPKACGLTKFHFSHSVPDHLDKLGNVA